MNVAILPQPTEALYRKKSLESHSSQHIRTVVYRSGRIVTSGQFLKKGLPGRIDTSGTKKRLKPGNCGNVTFHDEKISKQGGRFDTSLHVEARRDHGT